MNKSELSFFEKVKVAIPQYKFENVKKLGVGAHGAAYDIGNDIVLKITDDFSEAQASANVKGKKTKYINEIYDVFEVKETDEKKEYFIFQKKLKNIPEKEKDVLDWLLYVVSWYSESCTPTIEQFKKLVKDGSVEVLDGMFPGVLEKLKGYFENREFVSEIFKKYIRFWLDTKKELGNYKIEFHDYHIDNIMYGPSGEYILIDIGYAKAPKAKIENRILEYLKEKFK